MILLKLDKIKSFQEVLEKYNSMINLPYLECPGCKGTNLIRHSKYSRNIYYIDNNEIRHVKMAITRVKCKTCGTTHALLPICIIPYKLNTLEIIINALFNDQLTINISIDTITNWNKSFNKHLPYLKTMFGNIKKKDILEKIKNDIYNYYDDFYIKYQKILMMMRNGLKNICNF